MHCAYVCARMKESICLIKAWSAWQRQEMDRNLMQETCSNVYDLAILVSVQDSVYCAWLTWFVYFLFCPSLEHAKQLCLPPRNIPGAQICMIDFASCDQTVAYEPYKDRYVACRRHSYVDQVTGEAKGVCFVAKWYQDSWGEWKEAQPAVACAAIEYYGKGIVAQTIQNKINDNVKRCKDALCKVVPQFAIHSNHSTFINNSFNNYPYIITYLSPTEFNWNKISGVFVSATGHVWKMGNFDKVSSQESLAGIDLEAWNLGMGQNSWEVLRNLAGEPS